MEVLINNLAKEYFHRLYTKNEQNLDLVSFKEDDVVLGSTGTHSGATSGEIIYKKNDQLCQSECIFIKFLYTGTQSYDFDPKPWFDNEIHFYQEICQFLDSICSIGHLVPAFLGSKRDTNADFETIVIMFKRLGPEWVCNNYKSFVDCSHMSMMMRKLGEFHAYSFAAQQKDANKFKTLSTFTADMIGCSIPVYHEQIVAVLQKGLQALRLDPQYRQAVSRIDQILDDFPNQVSKSYSSPKGAKYYVLGHLSYIQSNVLFRYADGIPVDLKIMDWQTTSFSSLGVDLIVTLYLDISPQTRETYWDQLLHDYHEVLSTTFNHCDIPSAKDIFVELKHSVCAALYMMAYRVLKMNDKGGSGARTNSHAIWNNELITEMFKDMIIRGLL